VFGTAADAHSPLEDVPAALILFDEVTSVSLFLPLLSEQLENSLPFVLVRDYLVEPVTEMLDVLTFNKAFHGALEGPRPQ